MTLLFALLTLAALGFYLLCLMAARNLRKQAIPAANGLPPVSILKPLKGCDPEMYESLRSHCTQEYPQFEIIFGVNDAADEAIPYIDRLKSEFPRAPIRLVISARVFGANRKVSNLVQMLEHAQFGH